MKRILVKTFTRYLLLLSLLVDLEIAFPRSLYIVVKNFSGSDLNSATSSSFADCTSDNFQFGKMPACTTNVFLLSLDKTFAKGYLRKWSMMSSDLFFEITFCNVSFFLLCFFAPIKIAILIGAKKHNKKKDTLQKVISKNKSLDIIDHFLKYPFAKVLSNDNKKTLVVHAGILPNWKLSDVQSANDELVAELRSDPEKFLTTMYSDRGKAISKSTNKLNRRRYLVNVFTRMRFITPQNKLDLKTKLKKSTKESYLPWFEYDHKALNDVDGIIFGHWAAINGVTNHNKIKGVDLGCVWGGSLAAINIYDKSIITVESRK